MRFLAVLALCLLTFTLPAHAAPPVCNAGAEGTIIYNKDYKIVQFCNGTQWIGMVARIGDTGDTLADLSCSNGEIVKWSGTAWGCAADSTGGSPSWASITGVPAGFADGTDDGITSESDPQVGMLTGSKWCASNASGTVIDCMQNAPSSGLPALAASKIWVGDAGGAAAAVSMSGDATLSNAGVLTIANDVIGSAEITDASVGLADLSATGTKNNTTYLRGDNTWVAPTVSETDPQVGTLTGSKWCASNAGGTAVDCTQNAPGLPALASSKIWVGDAGGAAAAVSMSGDATLSNAGVLSLAANAVGNAEMADDAVGIAELSATGTASATTYLRGDNTWATISTGLPALASASLWVGNGTNVATAVTLSGDATMTNAGVLTLGTGVVTTTEILDSTIASADIAADVITAVDIATGGVATAEILDNTIVAADIAPDAITASELATNAVTTAEISDGTIALADLAANSVNASKIVDLSVTNADIANATIDATTKLSATGTKNSTTFLRGDNMWATPAGGGSANCRVTFQTSVGTGTTQANSATNTSAYSTGGTQQCTSYIPIGSTTYWDDYWASSGSYVRIRICIQCT